MRVIHSLLHPDDLAGLVERDYALATPVTVQLVNRGFNDTYLVSDGQGVRRILRVYNPAKYWVRSESDLLFELELLDHLAAAGISVSHPFRRVSGDLLGRLGAPEGERQFALLTFAPGSPVGERSAGPEQLRALGRQIAAMHAAMDDFRTDHGRYQLDTSLLLDMPLTEIEEYVRPLEDPLYEEIESLAQKLKSYISSLEIPPAGHGVIHADIHDGNVHLTPAGEFVVFDFDHCAFGWRAYDLVPFYQGTHATAEQRERWFAYLEGYEDGRPLSPDERQALPAFAACRALWDIGDWLRAAHWAGRRWDAERLCKQTLDRLRTPLADLDW